MLPVPRQMASLPSSCVASGFFHPFLMFCWTVHAGEEIFNKGTSRRIWGELYKAWFSATKNWGPSHPLTFFDIPWHPLTTKHTKESADHCPLPLPLLYPWFWTHSILILPVHACSKCPHTMSANSSTDFPEQSNTEQRFATIPSMWLCFYTLCVPMRPSAQFVQVVDASDVYKYLCWMPEIPWAPGAYSWYVARRLHRIASSLKKWNHMRTKIHRTMFKHNKKHKMTFFRTAYWQQTEGKQTANTEIVQMRRIKIGLKVDVSWLRHG